jgi:carbon monoxide dehydrogenase subunit G
MSEISSFESRTGKLDFGGKEVYNFVTDIRNFERFIPEGSVSNIKIEHDSCSFQVTMLGDVNIHIREKTENSKVIFAGNALHLNDFSLTMNISCLDESHSEVSVSLLAEMNPMLKMVAAEPVRQFLETLIREMEKFRDWANVK